MAKLRVWVATNKVGSKCERVVEIDDDELAEYEPGPEREDFLHEYAYDELPMMYEWGYELLD